MNDNTFHSQYISILKLMITNQLQLVVMEKVKAFVDRRRELSSSFITIVQQDAQKLLSFLLEKFCDENDYFKYVRHY